ncbi:stimulated by retinoic acid gene 6 protein-like isoform X2 [Haliotis rufescens]|nr:stimulated by retinoic acid gene 6 protein-like isoform X2 [Haliotis rufescens]XP_048254326.1 stimulated by retinoic acid gene 6 protein-like isoform X2 [Haliotis rufescens]
MEPTVPTTSCTNFFNYDTFTHFTTIPAVAIILVLAFLEKRKHGKGIWNGRPALIVPLNLLDGYENRLAFAAAFGAVTNETLTLFWEILYTDLEYPLWAVALILQLRVVEVTVVCFPLFACIATRHRLVGSVCGFLYSALLCGGVVTSLVQWLCESGHINKVPPAESIAIYLPVLVCYLCLMLRSAVLIIRLVASEVYSLQEDTDTVHPHQIIHVRLLLSGYYDAVLTKEETFRQKVCYRSIQGFKYPVKIVCAVFIITVILYQLAVAEIGFVMSAQELKNLDENIQLPVFNHTIIFLTPQAVDGMIGTYYAVAFVANAAAFIHIYFFLKIYRKNILRLHQGDQSFICQIDQRAQYIMASNLRFLGYLIAYSVWGTVIAFFFLLGLSLVVYYALFLMDANGYLVTFLTYVAQVLSFPATALILFYLQVVMARYVLLQDKIRPTDEDPPLNVDNRRFYEGFNFFSLFGSLTIGIFSCFLRILIGTVMGGVMVGRLDKTTFMRNMERHDRGHLSYISMLHVENSHNHPVVRVFCGVLWDETLQKRHDSQRTLFGTPVRLYRTFPDVEPSEDEHLISGTSGRKSQRQISVLKNTRYVRKWKLAYTLLRNPGLRRQRKTFASNGGHKPQEAIESVMVEIHDFSSMIN